MIGYCPANERSRAVGDIDRFGILIVNFCGENSVGINVKVSSKGSGSIECQGAWFTPLLAIDAVAGETSRLGFEIS